ncbi:MAG: hypothetical protein ACTTJD_02585 [Porphyromonadaceae bacterium]
MSESKGAMNGELERTFIYIRSTLNPQRSTKHPHRSTLNPHRSTKKLHRSSQ